MVTIPNFGSPVNPPRVSSASNRPLGILTKTVSASLPNAPSPNPPINALISRYLLQSLARELMPKERVHFCLRHRSPNALGVSVMKNEATRRAYYQGLMVCSSLWHCAVCAARISEGRRQDLTAAMKNAVGYSFALGTFTASHKITDKLVDVLNPLTVAFRKMQGSRRWVALREEYGILGTIVAKEVTYGKNGFHPHFHVFYVFNTVHSPAALHGLETTIKGYWLAALDKAGLSASWERGATLNSREKEITDYIAKWGHEPEALPNWGIEHELTKAVTKKAGLEGKTMNDLLLEYGDGNLKSGRLWQEYARAFKGKKQLTWSPGLRELLGVGVEKSDEELSQETTEKSDLRWAFLSPVQWKAILRADVRAEVLVKAGEASEEEFNLWLADLLTRWVVEEKTVQVRVDRASDGSYFVR